MRVLYTTASLDPTAGGPARSVPQLAHACTALGVEAGLWSPKGGSADGVLSDTVQVLQGSFEEALREFGRADIVHDNGVWQGCHREVARVCNERNIVRVVAPRGMLEPWALNHKKWKKKLAWYAYQKKNLQSAAALHATAKSEADQLHSLGMKSRIFIAPNGVDEPSFPMEKKVSSDEKTALFLSRIHPKKGLSMLVEAWRRLQPMGWKMRVVGPDEGGHLAEVQRLVAKAGLSDSWSFEDSLEGEDKWKAMHEADIFVLPTYSENFGIVVAEALAAGTPVLTTTGTPWSGLVEHGCGWWCEPNVDALEAELHDAMDAEVNYRGMGERGREWVKKEFEWNAIAKNMVGFYERIIDKDSSL